MGKDVAAGSGQKGGGGGVIDALGKAAGGAGLMAQCSHNLGLALAAVGGEFGQAPGGIVNRRPVTRQHLMPALRGQFVERRHVGPHVAIGGRHQRRGPTHRVIA